jgi:hypothetical protein
MPVGAAVVVLLVLVVVFVVGALPGERRHELEGGQLGEGILVGHEALEGPVVF